MANAFVHVELNTSDVSKAKNFYGKLFDWQLEDMPMGPMTYTMIRVGDDGTGGGITQHPMPGAPSAWIPYALVDDVKASTAKVQSLGGTVIKDVTEIPNMGMFSIVQDPTGGVLGLWEATGA
ncbi:MAG: VOC family protein [Candidatus Eremiobacteraeota bacterium]|nr:VOC family protein [Candidatus Eremiobacteraeota bacterium]